MCGEAQGKEWLLDAKVLAEIVIKHTSMTFDSIMDNIRLAPCGSSGLEERPLCKYHSRSPEERRDSLQHFAASST